MALNLLDELHALLASLDDAGIPYALAGGLAVAVWGAPRATKDIDLLIAPEDLERTTERVRSCGFTLPAQPVRFSDGMREARISKADGADLLTLDLLLADASLRTALDSRVRLSTERGALFVVSRDELIEMKLRAARPQDIADVQKLQELDR